MKLYLCLLGWLFTHQPAFGQTTIDLRTQGRNVDFSAAAATKPAKSGTSLPATCSPAELFFKIDAPAGQNIYGCTSANSWSLLTAKQLTDLQGISGKQGAAGVLQAFGGGATAPDDCARFDSAGNLVSAGKPCGAADTLNGNPLEPGAPATAGQFYAWDDGAGRLGWYTLGSLLSITGNVVNVATDSVPQYGASPAIPGACGQYGLFYFDTDAPAGAKLYYCNGSVYEGVSAAPGGGNFAIQFNSSSSLSGVTPNASPSRKFLVQSGDGTTAGAPTLDVLHFTDIPVMVGSGANHSAGAAPDPGATPGSSKFLREDGSWAAPPAAAAGLADPSSNGVLVRTALNMTTSRSLSAGSANIVIANGDGVSGNPSIDVGSNVELLNANQTSTGARTFAGKLDATGASSSAPFKTGLSAALPSTCDIGQTYYATDATPGRRLRTCTATNVWTPIAYDQGVVSALPGACAIGQIYFATDATAGRNFYFCTASNVWTQMAGSGTQSQAATQDITVFSIVEDFPNNAVAPNVVGTHGWGSAGNGTLASVPSAFPHNGIISISSGAASGNYEVLTLGNYSVGQGPLSDLGSNTNWEANYIFKLVTDTTSNTTYIGAMDFVSNNDPSNAGNHGLGVRFSSASGNFQYFVSSGGSIASADSGVAATTGSWYRLRIASTQAGVCTFSLYADGVAVGSPVTAGAGQTLNKALATSGMLPYFYISTTAAGARVLYADYFGFLQTGLGR